MDHLGPAEQGKGQLGEVISSARQRDHTRLFRSTLALHYWQLTAPRHLTKFPQLCRETDICT
jgi:hypothetical protein